ncbi:MAG: porin [Pirellulaceae bacterium]|nr:outer membrane beta-barrel protein [Planctomycetales bacterium]
MPAWQRIAYARWMLLFAASGLVVPAEAEDVLISDQNYAQATVGDERGGFISIGDTGPAGPGGLIQVSAPHRSAQMIQNQTQSAMGMHLPAPPPTWSQPVPALTPYHTGVAPVAAQTSLGPVQPPQGAAVTAPTPATNRVMTQPNPLGATGVSILRQGVPLQSNLQPTPTATPTIPAAPVVDSYTSPAYNVGDGGGFDFGDGSSFAVSSDYGCCDACGSCEPNWACATCRSVGGWEFSGWLDQGYTSNSRDPANGFNLPVTFNDRADSYQMNQLYLSLARVVNDGGCNWDLGGRVDVLFGTDYFFTTAVGLETHDDGSQRWNSEDGPRNGGTAAMYGLAMPQLYGELHIPWANGINLKVGHFYTILGYESVPARDNFFYSHSYTMQYGEPFTHTGFLFDTKVRDGFNILGGMTRGWDNWSDPNDSVGYLAGFNWDSPTGDTSFGFAVTSSREDAAAQQNRTVYSTVLTHRLSPCLTYIAQHDFGMEANAEINGQGQPDSAKWYGLNQYLLWDVNEKRSLGLRVEWFRDQDNARVLGIPFEQFVRGGNYVEVTLGTNYRPVSFLNWRSELRWDWSDVVPDGLGQNGMFNDFQRRNQMLAATDVIIIF